MNQHFKFFTLLLLLIGYTINAQQDPQFTQYNYNTMTVNPAYTGSRGHLTILSLYRDQWVGIEGAPKTLTFGIDAPVGENDGIGLSFIQDQLGPSTETYIDANYAHSIFLNRYGDRLSFGLKAGVRFFNLDWSKGRFQNPEAVFNENVNSRLLPTIGAGIFYFSDRAYLGLSTPNILQGEHYEEVEEAEATEKTHLFLIGGYVFDLNPFLKFKPAFFVKYVSGSPLSADISASILYNEKLTLGVNYRLDESIGALLGYQISNRLNIGYAYDYNTNDLVNYNTGTHEVFLRFQLISKDYKLKSPRFF